MESLDRELTLEIPHNMNLDTFAAHFFTTATDSSQKAAAIQLLNETSKATITSTDNHQHYHLQQQQQQRSSATIGNQFLQKLGETLFGFGGSSAAAGHSIGVSNSGIPSGSNMDLLRNHIVIDSADFSAVATSASSNLQQQLEYDKFMNEIWIGIVLTLIIISLVFCICSCFLYHQFRQWKRNYRHNLRQAQDIESVKLNPDADDPVPEYTLVSGLPSYEAALELMQKSTTLLTGGGGGGGNSNSSCLIVYPSLFNVFSMNEKDSCGKSSLSQSHPAAVTTSPTELTTPQSPSIGGAVTALLPATTTTVAAAAAIPTPVTMMTTTPTTVSQNVKCQNVTRLVLHSIPSYEEATGCQPQHHHQQQHQQQFQCTDTTSPCLMKSPNWCEDTTKVLLMEKKN